MPIEVGVIQLDENSHKTSSSPTLAGILLFFSVDSVDTYQQERSELCLASCS